MCPCLLQAICKYRTSLWACFLFFRINIHGHTGTTGPLIMLITSVIVKRKGREMNVETNGKRKWDWQDEIGGFYRSASLHFWSKSSAILSIFCFSSVLMDITLASCCCLWVSISSCKQTHVFKAKIVYHTSGASQDADTSHGNWSGVVRWDRSPAALGDCGINPIKVELKHSKIKTGINVYLCWTQQQRKATKTKNTFLKCYLWPDAALQ